MIAGNYAQTNDYRSAQSAGAVDYLNCISAKESDPLLRCPRYDTKLIILDLALELWGMGSTRLLPLLPSPFWRNSK